MLTTDRRAEYAKDNSDSQYRQFRAGTLPLIALAIAHLLAARWYAATFPDRKHRMPFLWICSTLVNVLLHGTSAVKMFTILFANFVIAKLLAGKHFFIPLIWLLNVAIMLSNEVFDGYRFSSLLKALTPLDSLQGLIPRWHVLYNFSMLRIVSFCVDFHWARLASVQKKAPSSHKPGDFTIQAFFAYVLYPPLYIAGPILPFDTFLSQLKLAPRIPVQQLVLYAMRLAFCWLTMEWILHHVYVNAIKNAQAWQGYSPAELGMIGFWILITIWLKLLIPWRFFRLWSLLDGIDPPENMVRCMSNNYSTIQFWRSWHRSFNRWIIRYIYTPLNGSLWARLLSFTFVAVWHDLRLHLLIWGWAVFIFLLPEYLARKYVSETACGHYWWYRHLCALGGALNIITMIAANLIGFALGHVGAIRVARQIFTGWQGWQFLGIAICEFYLLTQINFEYRQEEARHGIQRRC